MNRKKEKEKNGETGNRATQKKRTRETGKQGNRETEKQRKAVKQHKQKKHN